MIDRQYGEITFACDACDETLPTGEDEWGAAQMQFRQEGWKAEKVGGEWLHTCQKCCVII